MTFVVLSMAAVAVGFVGLALTERASVRSSRPGLRLAAVVVWIAIVLAGWLAFGYLALVAPGGLEGAWHWTRGQTITMQVAMWLLLLPYMGALWVSQQPWADWLRWLLVSAIAVATVLASASQLRQGKAADG